MKLRSATALLALALAPKSSALECGKWNSGPCLCETDLRYCADGENGASDALFDQHPFWKDVTGYYNFTLHLSIGGLLPAPQGPEWMFSYFPSYGFMNWTVDGSRASQHQYILEATNPNVNCSLAVPAADLNPLLNYDGECGVNGHGLFFDAFGTSSQERDGSLLTFGAFVEIGGQRVPFDEYKTEPADENTLFSTARSGSVILIETFSFINDEKTVANSLQDVFTIDGNTTSLAFSQRKTFTKIDKETFVAALGSAYNDLAIPASERAQVPMTKSCNYEPCPSEEDFCVLDPACATAQYVEPDATMKAGPIVGIVAATFVVLIGVLYLFHRKAMEDQAARNQAVFARRIAETIKLEGPDRALTPEALAEEFKKIDNGNVDGSIDKDELWTFINSGKVGKMDKKDFNALFSALDTDGDGTVSFMEFSAYMGKAYGDFERLKKRRSVQTQRGLAADSYYSGISSRIISSTAPVEDKVDKMEEINEKDEEAA